VDGSYHGHTLATLDVSPYKFEHSKEFNKTLISPTPNAGFMSPGKHIWKVPCPDIYRGKHRDEAKKAGELYASSVIKACDFYQSRGENVRAFILEGGMSVAGVILPPPGYLSLCVNAVRRAGGLYIADEVQTGFGRLGSCFWAFQYREETSEADVVVPDIVTVGKPFGNGMPLAAVVTSREVAKAFEQCDVEYFNTFGGNPVSASAGLAVLDVIEKEALQENALRVGTYLKGKLLDLKNDISWIGDVRGSGLFLGLELVRDRSTLEPATAETSWLCSILKTKYHILTSIDGFHNNVIVIKPPMVFSTEDADYFLYSLRSALTIDMPKAGKLDFTSVTPT
jgi:4-aminobutyrate aminotransferase-like enzyme